MGFPSLKRRSSPSYGLLRLLTIQAEDRGKGFFGLHLVCFSVNFRGMDLVELVSRSREHYVEQLAEFAVIQQRNCTQGSPEVKLQLGEESKLFEHLYCVDFINNDGKPEIIELQPDKILSFEPILGTFGSSNITIEHLCWDDMEIHYEGAEVPSAALAGWFQFWFDTNDERHNPEAQLSRVIHSLLLEPGVLSIDFGSADANAFWEILSIVEQHGATAIRIFSSRAKSET
jgi:hypothetical protein